MVAINKQDLINYLKKSPENLNFNIFGTMLDNFRNTYETDEQVVDKIKNIITNIIEDGGSISPEDDTITELVDLITELLPEKMIIKPVGTLEITENGEYDVMNKAGVNVEVPLPSGTIQITQNGNINVNDYEYADVNVVDPLGNLIRNNVTNLELSEGPTNIENQMFKDWTNLEEITIPNSVTTLGNEAFSGCTNLTTVNGGFEVQTVGENAFYNCPSVLSNGTTGDCKWAQYNEILTIDGNGNMANYPWRGNPTKWKESIKLIINNGVINIGKYAFSDCKNLTSVTIPDSVTSIGDDAFNGCAGLTSITIPDSVTSIGKSAFSDCTGLTSVTIGNSVTSIGESAFSGCKNLTSVTIPDSVTSIGGSAFSGTTWYNNQPNGLVYAGKVAYIYKGTMPANTSITLQEGTKGIAASAFERCERLTSVTIPDSVTSIGKYAFYGCKHLTDVYYTGTQEEWNNISLESGNTPLTNATIHYNYTPSN